MEMRSSSKAMTLQTYARLSAACVAGALAFPASAQFTIHGADRSDGAFSPIVSTPVPLSAASPGLWDAPSPVAGAGVYDAEQWAVVFKYSSVTIPAGVTVSFTNHPSRAPVVWLVDGPVTINGTLTVSGESAGAASAAQRPSEPGPGGFRGALLCVARTAPGSSGFGPGGGNNSAACDFGTAGRYATAYGSAQVIPLIGGSGGGRIFISGAVSLDGGAGGGAILIAATGPITVNGRIAADGGSGEDGSLGQNGAGGGIRLVTPALGGTGSVSAQRATGFNGENGRIAILADQQTLPPNNVQPPPFADFAPVGAYRAFPASSSSPKTARITRVQVRDVSSDPRSALGFPQADVILRSSGTYPIRVATRNMNPTQTAVNLRVNPMSGGSQTVLATFESGNTTQAIWLVMVPIQQATTSILQATASNVAGGITQIPQVITREVSVYARYCLADFDDGTGTGTPDGGVTIDDLLYYAFIYGEGVAAADVDDGTGTGTPDGGVTIDDLLYYLVRFEAGC